MAIWIDHFSYENLLFSVNVLNTTDNKPSKMMDQEYYYLFKNILDRTDLIRILLINNKDKV